MFGWRSFLATRNLVKLVPGSNPVGNLICKRNLVVHYTQPQRRMPFIEKVVYGIVISVSTMFYPVWVLLHVREYQGLKNK